MSIEQRVSNLASAIGAHINTAVAPRLLPAGGTTGHVLAKASGTDYTAEWVAPSGGGGGGTLGGGTPATLAAMAGGTLGGLAPGGL